MASVLCGFAAALQWGVSTTAVAAVAGEISARRFGFWFQFTQTVVVLIPGVVVGVASAWTLGGVAILAGAAALQGVALVTFRISVGREQLGVVAPLIALEGAVAALLAIIAGETIPPATGIGLVLSVVGGWLVGASRRTYRISTGSAYAVLTAIMFGGALWLLARSGVEPVVALLLFNGLATIPFVSKATTEGQHLLGNRPSGRQAALLLVAGLGSIGGQLAFVVGVRAGAGAVTAVLSAQSAVIAAIGGYVLFHERLRAQQLGGFAVLMVGVSLVALATG
jgi:drug/metabolite transporter (DMT)-like permease